MAKRTAMVERKRTRGSVLLKRHLDDRDMKLRDFAKRAECAESYVSMLVSGQVTPGLSLAATIETLTGIPCKAWTEAAA